MTTRKADFLFADGAPDGRLEPVSPAAKAWTEKNLPAHWTRNGAATIPLSYAKPVLREILREKLSVALANPGAGQAQDQKCRCAP